MKKITKFKTIQSTLKYAVVNKAIPGNIQSAESIFI